MNGQEKDGCRRRKGAINALYSESKRESLTEGKTRIRRERNPVSATQTQIMIEVNPTQEQSFKVFF